MSNNSLVDQYVSSIKEINSIDDDGVSFAVNWKNSQTLTRRTRYKILKNLFDNYFGENCWNHRYDVYLDSTIVTSKNKEGSVFIKLSW